MLYWIWIFIHPLMLRSIRLYMNWSDYWVNIVGVRATVWKYNSSVNAYFFRCKYRDPFLTSFHSQCSFSLSCRYRSNREARDLQCPKHKVMQTDNAQCAGRRATFLRWIGSFFCQILCVVRVNSRNIFQLLRKPSSKAALKIFHIRKSLDTASSKFRRLN